MDRDSVNIRGYRAGDLHAVYRVCLQTARNGQDGTALFRDPDLPGHVYLGPYLAFEPSLALVAEDAAGVGGYIVAALDSQSFQHRLERDWWPGLRARYPEPSPEVAERLSLQERRAIGNIHRHFGAPDAVTRRFPSHLHINLVAHAGPRNRAAARRRADLAPAGTGIAGTAPARPRIQRASDRLLPARWLHRGTGRSGPHLHHAVRCRL